MLVSLNLVALIFYNDSASSLDDHPLSAVCYSSVIIDSCPPYLEAVSSIHVKTRFGVVAGTHLE